MCKTPRSMHLMSSVLSSRWEQHTRHRCILKSIITVLAVLWTNPHQEMMVFDHWWLLLSHELKVTVNNLGAVILGTPYKTDILRAIHILDTNRKSTRVFFPTVSWTSQQFCIIIVVWNEKKSWSLAQNEASMFPIRHVNSLVVNGSCSLVCHAPCPLSHPWSLPFCRSKMGLDHVRQVEVTRMTSRIVMWVIILYIPVLKCISSWFSVHECQRIISILLLRVS